MRILRSALYILYWVVLMCGVSGRVEAQDLPRFDFATSGTLLGWQSAHDISRLTPTAQGLEITISGDDPYLFGPARNYPTGQALWLTLRLKSAQSGNGQIFYFPHTSGPNETDSVRFFVKSGEWTTIRVPLPPLAPGYTLRFDPPGNGGVCLLASMAITPRHLFPAPIFPTFALPETSDNIEVKSGRLRVAQNRTQWGGFTVTLDGAKMATGITAERIGYLVGAQVRWLDLSAAKVSVRSLEGKIEATAIAFDPDGATWRFTRTFAPLKQTQNNGDAIEITTTVQVSAARAILWLPLFSISAGAGSFGETKNQAVFGGLEYLDKNEPSRSEADIIGPESQRQLPENYKITLPLMAVQQSGHYIGLTWDGDPKFSALFDSPDRIYHSGGHLMARVFPGSVPGSRAMGSLLPYEPTTLQANAPLVLKCTLIGGAGDSVVPAIQQTFARMKPLPLPTTTPDLQSAIRAEAAGWLDSKLRDGAKFHHAFPGRYSLQTAGDAALWLDYLAAVTTDKPLAERLRVAQAEVLAAIPQEELNFAGVGHVRTPAPALLYGATMQNAERAAVVGRSMFHEFDPDGSVHYQKPEKGNDLSRTHFAPDANGLTAQKVAAVLELAIFSGDADLTAEGIRLLRGLDKFKNTVPRGAQTWEVPLHTPDILASANLVRAYALGYELTGEKGFYQSAEYWAWTGLPFVYLRNPTGQAIGPYATIAVFGATQWVAPDWMGLPVQWCGMVYADSLRLLARSSPKNTATIWTQIADGITASALQQTYPIGSDAERVGLLPDSFNLVSQSRNDPAINPGTALSGLPALYHLPPIYDYRVCREAGLIVHAPGKLSAVRETKNGVAFSISFSVQCWKAATYDVLITGLKRAPEVRLNGQEISLNLPNRYDEKTGRLILHLSGQPNITVRP